MMTPETGNGWFPTIGPTGRIGCGNVDVFVGAPQAWRHVGRGGGVQWIGPDIITYGGGDETVVYDLSASQELGRVEGYNHRISATNGRWCGTRNTGTREYMGSTMVRDWGRDAFPVALSPNGSRIAHVDRPLEDLKTLYVNDVALDYGAILSASLGNADTCWLVATGTYSRAVRGVRQESSIIEDWSVLSWESPVLVDTLDGPWIYSTTQTGFILRPAGSTVGYQYTGDYFYPSVRYIDGGFTVVSSTERGVFQYLTIPLSAPRVHLGEALPPIEVPPTQPPVEPPVEPPTIPPLEVTVRSWTSEGSAPFSIVVDYAVSNADAVDETLVVATLLVNGVALVQATGATGLLTTPALPPGQYPIAVRLAYDDVEVARTGVSRIVTVHPPVVPPTPTPTDTLSLPQIAQLLSGVFFEQISALLGLQGSEVERRPVVHEWTVARCETIDALYREIFDRPCDPEGFGSRVLLYVNGATDTQIRQALRMAWDNGDR